MENQIEIVKDIADGMIGIGGIPSNEEFYAEFDMRVRAALRIPDVVGRSEQLKCDDNELDCPYDFTSRCTMGRCDCKPKAN